MSPHPPVGEEREPLCPTARINASQASAAPQRGSERNTLKCAGPSTREQVDLDEGSKRGYTKVRRDPRSSVLQGKYLDLWWPGGLQQRWSGPPESSKRSRIWSSRS